MQQIKGSVYKYLQQLGVEGIQISCGGIRARLCLDVHEIGGSQEHLCTIMQQCSFIHTCRVRRVQIVEPCIVVTYGNVQKLHHNQSITYVPVCIYIHLHLYRILGFQVSIVNQFQIPYIMMSKSTLGSEMVLNRGPDLRQDVQRSYLESTPASCMMYDIISSNTCSVGNEQQFMKLVIVRHDIHSKY